MTKRFKIVASGFILLIVAACFLVVTIPPRSLTADRMFLAKRRILQFAHQNNKLPSTRECLRMTPM